MKKLAILMIFILLCPLALANEVYVLDHKSKTSPNIVISKIEITDDSTIVSMTYHATTSTEAGLHRPDSPLGYVILDVNSKRVYSMIGAEGMSIRPQTTAIEAGQSLTFKVIFERINTNHFHVIEGRPQHRDSSETFWDFTNIKLQKRD